MARRVTTPSRTSSRRAPEPAPAPKKRLGRPPGSKNRVPGASKAKAAPASTNTVRRKSAPVAPKLNKAELEAHAAKLERLIVRLRKQNAELKQAARDSASEPVTAPAPAPEAAETPAPARDAAPARKPKRSATPKTARATRSKAVQPAPDLDETPDESTED